MKHLLITLTLTLAIAPAYAAKTTDKGALKTYSFTFKDEKIAGPSAFSTKVSAATEQEAAVKAAKECAKHYSNDLSDSDVLDLCTNPRG